MSAFAPTKSPPGGAARRLLDPLRLAVYHLGGRRPFSSGYTAYRRHRVLAEINSGEWTSLGLPEGYGVGLDERIVEYPWFFSKLPGGAGKLLDAGSALNFLFLLRHPVFKEKRVFISTLGPEQQCYWFTGTSYVYEDLRTTCYRDSYFDWIVCLSTLEHIGLDTTMYVPKPNAIIRPDSYLETVRELARVLRPGGTLYLSVPFGVHKDHGWLQVFDAPMLDGVVDAFGRGRCEETHFRWYPTGWRASSRTGSAGATYHDWHSVGRFYAERPVAAEAVACLTLHK